MIAAIGSSVTRERVALRGTLIGAAKP